MVPPNRIGPTPDGGDMDLTIPKGVWHALGPRYLAQADLGISIPAADPQDRPCRGLAARHGVSVYVPKG